MPLLPLLPLPPPPRPQRLRPSRPLPAPWVRRWPFQRPVAAHAGTRSLGRVGPWWALWALVLVALALAGLGWWGRQWWLGDEVATLAVGHGSLRQTVVASGRVSTPQRLNVAAETVGRVRAVPVAEGQRVAAGQALVLLQDRDEQAAVAQAQAALALAQAQWRQLLELQQPVAEQGLTQALASATQTNQQAERQRRLQAQGFIGQAMLDQAQLSAQVAASQLHSAQLQLASSRSGGSAGALLQAGLAQAQATLLAAQLRLAQQRVLAPVAGTLIARSVEPGSVVLAGQVLMVLAPDGDTELIVLVDEKYLARLALGQSAQAAADAFASQRFAARLSYINPGVDSSRGAVEVKLRVPQPPAFLRQDMTVSVEIETAQRSATTVAPTAALHDASGTTPWVLVLRQGRAVRQPVSLGLRGDEQVEVLSGLHPGEPLVPAALALYRPGQRLRSQAAATP